MNNKINIDDIISGKLTAEEVIIKETERALIFNKKPKVLNQIKDAVFELEKILTKELKENYSFYPTGSRALTTELKEESDYDFLVIPKKEKCDITHFNTALQKRVEKMLFSLKEGGQEAGEMYEGRYFIIEGKAFNMIYNKEQSFKEIYAWILSTVECFKSTKTEKRKERVEFFKETREKFLSENEDVSEEVYKEKLIKIAEQLDKNGYDECYKIKGIE